MMRRLAAVVLCTAAVTSCESQAPTGLRVDLTALQRGIDGVSISKVIFEGACDDGSGPVLFKRDDGDITDKLTLDPNDDDTYLLTVKAPCEATTFVVTLYRAPTASEVVEVTAAIATTPVSVTPGDQDIVFPAARAGEVLLGFQEGSAATPCALILEPAGGEARELGDLEPGDAIGLSLLVGTYTALCQGADFALGPQTFTISFAERTLLELVPPKTTTPRAERLVFVQPPATSIANGDLWPSFSVRAVDKDGAPVDVDNLTVSVASATTPLFGNLTATTTDGVATFDSIKTTLPGIALIDVTAPGLTGIFGTQITITSKPAATLAFVSSPKDGSVDSQQDITVALLDAGGNPSLDVVAVSLRLGPTSPSGAVCIGCAPQMTSGGIATFTDVQLSEPGAYTLFVDAPSLASISANVNIALGAPHHLNFSMVPGPTGNVDTPLVTIALEVRDQFEHSIMDDGTPVELVSTAAPSSALAFTNNVAVTNGGRANFVNVRAKVATSQTVNARFVTSPSVVTNNPFNISVSPGTAAALAFINPPVTAKAGLMTAFSVRVVDAFGNFTLTPNVPSLNVTVPTDGTASVSGTEIVANQATPTVTFRVPGAQTVHAQSGVLNGDAIVLVSPGDPVLFMLSGAPTGVTAGANVPLTVAVQDVVGNVVTDFTGSISITTSPTPDPVINYTYILSDAGSHTFMVPLHKAGPAQNIVVDSNPPGPIMPAIFGPYQVTNGPLTTLVFQTQPPVTIGTGALFTVVVEGQDAFQNPVLDDPRSVSIDVAPGAPTGATLGGSRSLSLDSSGRATFTNMTFSTPGPQRIRADDGISPPVDSNVCLVNPTPHIGLVCSNIVAAKLNLAVHGANFEPTPGANTFTYASQSVPAIAGDGQNLRFIAPPGITGATSITSPQIGQVQLTVTNSIGTSLPHTLDVGPSKVYPSNLEATSGIYARDPAVNADGRFIAFVTNDSAFLGETGPADDDIFVYDRVGNMLNAASVRDDGTESTTSAGFYARDPSISADGCLVAFVAVADDLGGTANGSQQVYLRSVCNPHFTKLISHAVLGITGATGAIDPRTVQGNADSRAPQISANGRYIVYESDATNLVFNDTPESSIFLYDLALEKTERLSEEAAGPVITNFSLPSRTPTVSGDGRYVAFETEYQTSFGNSCATGAGVSQVLWIDRWRHETRCVSRATGVSGAASNNYSYDPSISLDGRYIAFASAATTLDAQPDSGGNSDIFVRDTITDVTTRVTVNDADDTTWVNVSAAKPKLSADGDYIAFVASPSGASGLVAGNEDANGFMQAYVRRLKAPQTTSLVSRDFNGVVGNKDTTDIAISMDGGVVALRSSSDFLTTETGAPTDTDVYVTTSSRSECPSPLIYHVEPQGFVRPDARISIDGIGFDTYGTQCSFGPGQASLLYADTVHVEVRGPTGAIGALACNTYGIPSISVPTQQGPLLSSVNNAMMAGTNGSTQPRLSLDGGVIAFTSATPFDGPPDDNNTGDVYVRDRLASFTGRMSPRIPPSNTPVLAERPDISYDGRYVVFETAANNMIPTDTDSASDVYMFDRLTLQLTRVSVNGTGMFGGNAPSTNARISGNGRYVAFVSRATDLDAVTGLTGPTGAAQIFVRDMLTKTTRLVSRDTFTRAAGDCVEPTIDAFGTGVAFSTTSSNFLGGNGTTKQVYYVALGGDVFELSPPPLAPRLMSENVGHTPGDGNSVQPALSGDGDTIAFASVATNLLGIAPPAAQHIYYRATAPSSPAFIASLTSQAQGSASPALDFNGGLIAFESSATDLDPTVADGNNKPDVYVFDGTDAFCISVNQAGAVLADGGREPAISAFGKVVAFVTRDQLSGNDATPGGEDIYLSIVPEAFGNVSQ